MNQRRSLKRTVYLCAFIYFISYITRINYGAIVAEMVADTGLSKSALSMALTGSFITYGAGQVISGIFGDRYQPKTLVALGLVLPSGCPQDIVEIVIDRVVRQQLEILEHHAHLSAQCRQLAGVQLQQVSVQHLCTFSLAFNFAIDCFQQRGLSAANGTDEINHLSLLRPEIHVGQNLVPALVNLYLSVIYGHCKCLFVQ